MNPLAFRQGLVGDDKEDARYVDALLADVDDFLKENSGASKLTRLRVREKNPHKKSQFNRFTEFAGCDDGTAILLDTNFDTWDDDSQLFWPASSTYSSAQSRLAKRWSCELLLRCTERIHPMSVEHFAEAIHIGADIGESSEAVSKELNVMLRKARKYRWLESRLGPGITAVLGTGLPEHHWTNLLTKKDSEGVISHLKSLGLDELGQRYAQLKEKIICTKFNDLCLESLGTSSTGTFSAYTNDVEAGAEEPWEC